jgi:hypothetical protein
MEDNFNDFRLLIARNKSAGGDMSATSVALTAMRTFSDCEPMKAVTVIVDNGDNCCFDTMYYLFWCARNTYLLQVNCTFLVYTRTSSQF